MQVTSLTGVSYQSTKRTTPRNHQSDLMAREHYKNRAANRPHQEYVKVSPGVGYWLKLSH